MLNAPVRLSCHFEEVLLAWDEVDDEDIITGPRFSKGLGLGVGNGA